MSKDYAAARNALIGENLNEKAAVVILLKAWKRNNAAEQDM